MSLSEIHQKRISNLFTVMDDTIEVCVLSPGENLRYFTGINLPQRERPILVVLKRDDSHSILVHDFESKLIEDEFSKDSIFVYSDSISPVSSATDKFGEIWRSIRGYDHIAVDYYSMRLVDWKVIQKYVNGLPSDSSKQIFAIREVKTDEERKLISESANIADDILTSTCEYVEPGVTELEVKNEIEHQLLDSPAEKSSSSLVVSGERTGYPHSRTSNRTIQSGDLVILDLGVRYEGYYTDIAWTVAVDEINREFEEMYNVIQNTYHDLIESTRPEMSCHEIYDSAFRSIENVGHVNKFLEHIGHGIGLSGHEPPIIAKGNDESITVGNVLTIEPGLYIHDVGGIRIEDTCYVEEDGLVSFSDYPKELKII